MKSNRLSIGMTATLTMFTLALFLASASAAPGENVLHNFHNKDASDPQASLISDAAGNLYGTAFSGGAHACGTVFELMRTAKGGWTEKVLHNFNRNGKDGCEPSASLLFDATGNLYGTTYDCGAHEAGTVFELTPQAGGVWTEKILHNFSNNGTDGSYPNASLISDASGNLYGTTTLGGAAGGYHGAGGGTVFELTPKAGGVWTEKILHKFNNNGKDGYYPNANLIFDAASNLYGTTVYGGELTACNGYGCGTVFELTPKAGGGWTEKILHNFTDNSDDGFYPVAGLIVDAGILYGTTAGGGTGWTGTVFELTPEGGGNWTENVLYDFSSNGGDGYGPQASLIFDAAMNLYSTTVAGGADGVGTVFELTPHAGGSWTERVLYSFTGKDGNTPQAGLILDDAGHLYGTTELGGTFGGGAVFEVRP